MSECAKLCAGSAACAAFGVQAPGIQKPIACTFFRGVHLGNQEQGTRRLCYVSETWLQRTGIIEAPRSTAPPSTTPPTAQPKQAKEEAIIGDAPAPPGPPGPPSRDGVNRSHDDDLKGGGSDGGGGGQTKLILRAMFVSAFLLVTCFLFQQISIKDAEGQEGKHDSAFAPPPQDPAATAAVEGGATAETMSEQPPAMVMGTPGAQMVATVTPPELGDSPRPQIGSDGISLADDVAKDADGFARDVDGVA